MSPAGGLRLTEQRGPDGWCEVGIWRGAELLAVVSHPCAGARWFLYPQGSRRLAFRTRGAALDAALAIGRTPDDYQPTPPVLVTGLARQAAQ